MPGFPNVQSMVDAELDGKSSYQAWFKTPSQASPAGVWFDLSMSPGMPIPQYYAATPLKATVLSRSNDLGLLHGGNVGSGRKKFIKQLTAMSVTATALPLPLIICDYLMFYPFIDEGTLDEQLLDNTNALTRYTDGNNVEMMAVSVAGRTGNQTFQVKYTNQAGVTGRITPQFTQITNAVNGSIVTSTSAGAAARGPFLPLQQGDTGVRAIESVQMISGTDVGLFSLVLVVPLAQGSIRGVDAPVEVNYLRDFSVMPVVQDDAYLNFLTCPQGTLAATRLMGDFTTIWSD